MITTPIDTGDKLKAARKALGLTDSEMAASLRLAGGNARRVVRDMEDGKRPISGPIQVAVEGLLREAELERKLDPNGGV